MDAEEFEVGKAKAEKHLNGVSDLTMMVLKGHLLLEETLFAALRRQFPDPEAFEKLNLRFVQMVHLARAMFATKSEDPKPARLEAIYWDALEALNALRNKFAHQIEPVSAILCWGG